MLLSVQERPYIPFASMTKFQVKLALCAEEQRIVARAFSNSGDSVQASIFTNLAVYLEGIVSNKTPAQSANTLAYFGSTAPFNSIVNDIVKKASIGGDAPAMTYRGGDYDEAIGVFQNPNDADFMLTPAEEAACEAEARRLAGNFDNNRSLFLQRLGEFRRKCKVLKAMEKVVNAKLRDTGAMLIYHYMPFSNNNTRANKAVSDKAGAQLFWINSTVDLTGLDKETIEGIIKNGLLNQLDNRSFQSIFQELREGIILGGVIPPNSANNGLQEFTVFVTILTLVITAIKVGVELIGSIQALSQKKYNDALDPSLIKPAQEDLNGDGKPDSEQSSLVVYGNQIGAAVSAVAGVAGGLLIKNKAARNAVIAGSLVATSYFGVKALTNEKRWLVDGESLTAKEMEDRDYVLHEGEWYKAQEVANESGQNIGDILKGGKELFDTIKGVFDLIKGRSASDTNIFIGEPNAINPGDA